MTVRGVYTEEEAEFIARWKEESSKGYWLGEEISDGEPYPVFHRIATRDAIRCAANAISDPNPLWHDENYARNTRWGTIIAPPFFPHYIAFGGGGAWNVTVPPGVGVHTRMNIGATWHFFKPIRLNDSFKVRVGPTSIEDKTRRDGKGPRQFLTVGSKKYINQNDQLACAVSSRFMIVIRHHPKEGEEPILPTAQMTEYRYCEEEIQFINRICEEQEMRSDKPRYWEDVNPGDELKPIVRGPITGWDSALAIQGAGHLVTPLRDVCKKTPSMIVVDPITHIPHKTIERHFNDRVAQMLGDPMAIVIGVLLDFIMGQVITNWMGDDGFLTKFDNRNRAIVPLGDTIFGRGKVIKKYIENGKHLLDVSVWEETIRGYIAASGMATISLTSRESGE